MLLVDGNSMVHRAFWASMNSPKFSNDQNSQAFIMMFEKAIKVFKDNEVIVVFDKNKHTWRHELYPAYKANRKEAPENLLDEFKNAKTYLESKNVPMVECNGFEGDDLIGTLCKHFIKKDKMILSSDHDLLQLVNDNTKVCLMLKGLSEIEIYDEWKVIEKKGVSPKQIPDLKALMGDKSDNIKGVEKVGNVLAHKLLDEFKNVEDIYQNLNMISRAKTVEYLSKGKADCFLSKKLATIKTDVDLNFNEIEEKLKKYVNTNRAY